MQTSKGRLFLIPSPLFGGESGLKVIAPEVLNVLSTLKHLLVEDLKSARHILRDLGMVSRINEMEMYLLNEHTAAAEIKSLVMPLEKGEDIGIMSDAGCPGIADPGSSIVAYAHSHSIEVVPLTGPSSILLSLMASGMNGQGFTFHGYLPRDKNARIQKIRDIEKQALQTQFSQIFIETPYRNQYLFEDILSTCNGLSRLFMGIGIHGPKPLLKTMNINSWKKNQPGDISKTPAVFILSA